MDIHPIIEEIFRGEKPKSIFEIGCAAGWLMKPYTDVHPGIKVGGIDTTPGDIDGARVNFPNGEFFLQDANLPWPLKDKSYDIVFTVGLFTMIPGGEGAIREALRVGKKVIFAEMHDESKGAEGFDISTSMWPNQQRYSRNYYKTMEQFGIKPTITQILVDKWIIRCQ